MLPFVVVIVLVLYVILDKTGVLADLADTFKTGDYVPPDRRREQQADVNSDPEVSRRLEVFEEFIERLEGEDDEEQG